MPNYRTSCVLVTLFAVAACHRAQQGPERLPTVPVRGSVTYKGAAAPGVNVQFHTTGTPQGMSEIYAAKPGAVTDVEGKFALSTYEEGDGVAAGEYVVTFEWKDFDPLKNGYSGPDRLKGKYSDPETSEFRVTIAGDEKQGVDLKPFELVE